jgi:hypothetical protein
MILKPPIRYIFTGNSILGKKLRGLAKNQMAKLERSMSFQNLTQDTYTIRPFNDVIIKCTKCFNRRTIEVDVQSAGQQNVIYLENQVYYFIRIKSSDPESYPQDLDGWCSTSYPEIQMDRIILFDFDKAFKGNVSDIDPELENTTNRGHKFTPGGGTVAFDVDILNDVVYFPIPGSDEEELNIVNKIKRLAVDLPTNAVPSPLDCLQDIALDAFGFGRMSDPIQNAFMGGYDKPTASLTYDISYTYAIADAVWHTTIDTYPIREPENDVPYSLALIAWQEAWSPLSGGYTDTYLDAYDFSRMGDVSGYYGKFGFDASIGGATYYEHITQTANPNEYDVIVLHSSGDLFSEDGRNLIDGMFLAPNDTSTTTPPFFCLFTSRNNNGVSAIAIGGNLLETDPDVYDVSYDYGELHASLGTNRYITDVTTPLEEFTLLEIMKVSEAIDNNPPCTEAPCWFGLSDSVYAWWKYNLPYGAHLLDWSPCPIPQTFFDVYGRITKTTTAYDTHRSCSFHIADPNYATFKKQKNYTSFLVFSEIREEHGQGICQDYYTAADPADICTCNGNTFTRENMPSLPYSAVGVAIYIFAPETIYTLNPLTGLKELSWDIHTARRDPGIINPYRSLALEEYVNTVLTDIQVFLDATTTIPKLADGLAYTMNYYGFGITDGFSKKGKVRVH